MCWPPKMPGVEQDGGIESRLTSQIWLSGHWDGELLCLQRRKRDGRTGSPPAPSTAIPYYNNQRLSSERESRSALPSPMACKSTITCKASVMPRQRRWQRLAESSLGQEWGFPHRSPQLGFSPLLVSEHFWHLGKTMLSPTLPQRRTQEGNRERMRSLVYCLNSGIPMTLASSPAGIPSLLCSSQNSTHFKAQFRCLLLFCEVFSNSTPAP